MRRKTVVAVTAFLVSLGFKYLLLAINGETIGRVEDAVRIAITTIMHLFQEYQ